MQKLTWVFIRGLNTWGDNRLHLGPVPLSLFHEFLAPKLVTPDLDFVALEKLGAGTLEELTARAAKEIQDRILSAGSENAAQSVILLGHSMGGLVARALVHQPQLRSHIKGVVTLASPHRGTPLVRYAQQQFETQSWVGKAARVLGYDLAERIDFLRELSDVKMEDFNKRYPDIPNLFYGSIVASPTAQQRSLPLKVFDHAFQGAHDGMVPVESQTWGETLGEFQLDHYAVLGLRLHSTPGARTFAENEFHRLTERLREIPRRWICSSAR